MRSFTTILATASLAASALAFPEQLFSSKKIAARDGACMSQADATQVADNFQALIANYSDELANASLTVDFEDYSASVSSLIDAGCTGPQPVRSLSPRQNHPVINMDTDIAPQLNTATFNSRAEFEAAQGAQPPIPFERLNLWYNCNTAFLRWRTALTPEFVTGIIVLETTQAPAGSQYGWLIVSRL